MAHLRTAPAPPAATATPHPSAPSPARELVRPSSHHHRRRRHHRSTTSSVGTPRNTHLPGAVAKPPESESWWAHSGPLQTKWRQTLQQLELPTCVLTCEPTGDLGITLCEHGHVFDREVLAKALDQAPARPDGGTHFPCPCCRHSSPGLITDPRFGKLRQALQAQAKAKHLSSKAALSALVAIIQEHVDGPLRRVIRQAEAHTSQAYKQSRYLHPPGQPKLRRTRSEIAAAMRRGIAEARGLRPAVRRWRQRIAAAHAVPAQWPLDKLATLAGIHGGLRHLIQAVMPLAQALQEDVTRHAPEEQSPQPSPRQDRPSQAQLAPLSPAPQHHLAGLPGTTGRQRQLGRSQSFQPPRATGLFSPPSPRPEALALLRRQPHASQQAPEQGLTTAGGGNRPRLRPRELHAPRRGHTDPCLWPSSATRRPRNLAMLRARSTSRHVQPAPQPQRAQPPPGRSRRVRPGRDRHGDWLRKRTQAVMTELRALADHHDDKKLHDLLQHGADTLVHVRTKDGDTLIHRAAKWGNARLVLALLQLGAPTDVARGEKKRATPMSLACYGGHASAAEALLAHGADPNFPGQFAAAAGMRGGVEHADDSAETWTPRYQIAQALLDCGFDPRAPTSGQPRNQITAALDLVTQMRRESRDGPPVSLSPAQMAGLTLVIATAYAASGIRPPQHGHPPKTNKPLPIRDLQALAAQDLLAFARTPGNSMYDRLKTLVGAAPRPRQLGRRAQVIEKDEQALLERLLRAGLNLGQLLRGAVADTLQRQRRLAHQAARTERGAPQPGTAPGPSSSTEKPSCSVAVRPVPMLGVLLDTALTVFRKKQVGAAAHDALRDALEHGHAGAARALLAAGADPNRVLAQCSGAVNLAAVRCLIEGEPNADTPAPRTSHASRNVALHAAVLASVEGARAQNAEVRDRAHDIIQVLLSHETDANQRQQGYTPLARAAALGAPEAVVRTLVVHGADPATAMRELVANDHFAGAAALADVCEVSANPADGGGQTPLRAAVATGNLHTIQQQIAACKNPQPRPHPEHLVGAGARAAAAAAAAAPEPQTGLRENQATAAFIAAGMAFGASETPLTPEDQRVMQTLTEHLLGVPSPDEARAPHRAARRVAAQRRTAHRKAVHTESWRVGVEQLPHWSDIAAHTSHTATAHRERLAALRLIEQLLHHGGSQNPAIQQTIAQSGVATCLARVVHQLRPLVTADIEQGRGRGRSRSRSRSRAPSTLPDARTREQALTMAIKALAHLAVDGRIPDPMRALRQRTLIESGAGAMALALLRTPLGRRQPLLQYLIIILTCWQRWGDRPGLPSLARSMGEGSGNEVPGLVAALHTEESLLRNAAVVLLHTWMDAREAAGGAQPGHDLVEARAVDGVCNMFLQDSPIWESNTDHCQRHAIRLLHRLRIEADRAMSARFFMALARPGNWAALARMATRNSTPQGPRAIALRTCQRHLEAFAETYTSTLQCFPGQLVAALRSTDHQQAVVACLYAITRPKYFDEPDCRRRRPRRIKPVPLAVYTPAVVTELVAALEFAPKQALVLLREACRGGFLSSARLDRRKALTHAGVRERLAAAHIPPELEDLKKQVLERLTPLPDPEASA